VQTFSSVRANIVERYPDGLYELGTVFVEIPLIIELPPVFSVEIAVAGAKNGLGVFLDRDARFSLPRSGGMVFRC